MVEAIIAAAPKLINLGKNLLSGVKGKTPHLPDPQVWGNAVQQERSLWEAGILKYQGDPDYREAFRSAMVSYIGRANPGQARRRSYYIGQVNAHAGRGGIGLADLFAYTLHGVSTNPNDPTGVGWRINDVMTQVVVPVVRDYEQRKGIISSTVKIGGEGKGPSGDQVQKAGVDVSGIGLLIGVVILVGLLIAFFAGKKKGS